MYFCIRRNFYLQIQRVNGFLIKIGFQVNGTTLTKLQALREGQEFENLTLEKTLCSEKLCYNDNLSITYSNGITQTHRLAAFVACPSFQVSTDVLDFSTSFVGQEIHRQVTIANRSGVDTRWRASIRDVSHPENGEFRIEPTSGKLDAFLGHQAYNKQLLFVSFVARKEGPCEASIVFEGCLLEPVHVIKILGSGSLDGQFELK